MVKKIVWVTPISVIDNNVELVPYLSKIYQIHWVIVSSAYPKIFDKIKTLESKNLSIEYYANSTRWYSPLSLFSHLKFYRHLIKYNADAIYLNGLPQFFAYYAAIRVLPLNKVIIALHNAKVPKGARLEHFARYYTKKVIKNFPNLHVFSQNQKDYLETHSTGRNILLAGLPLLNYGPRVKRTDNLDIVNFLAFGFIRRYKRFDLLIEAAQLLYDEIGPRFKVTIAGMCKNWNEYEKMIRVPELFNLNIGYIDDEDVAAYFANADYLVQPYQDLAQSGPMLLATYYGVPVIASDIDAFKEFIQEDVNGYFFHSEDAVSLKELMKCLLEKPSEERNRVKNNIDEKAKKEHSFEALSEKYSAYLDKL